MSVAVTGEKFPLGKETGSRESAASTSEAGHRKLRVKWAKRF